MPSPRQPKDEPRPPDSLITAGGGTSTDRLYEISQRVATIERSMTYLEGHADDAKRRLDAISTQLTEAKATFKTLQIIGAGICAIFAGIFGILSAISGMWLKHHFGW